MMLRRVAGDDRAVQGPGEALRAHGLAGRDVELDELAQDFPASLVEGG